MTREEAIKWTAYVQQSEPWQDKVIEALDMAIEALKHERTDEWCTDCKEYDTEKKCCPRFNRVIRGAMKREPSEDGTLEVKVEDATKVGRVLISDDKHRGGLYYPDEDEPKGEPMKTTDYCDICKRDMCEFCVADNSNPYCVPSHYEIKQDEPQKGDLISRADAIEAMGEEPLVWCDEDYEIAERDQWREDVEAIKSVPSADRPRGEWIHTPNGTDRDFVWWVCSECGHKIFSETEKDRIEFHAYCGRCGADMRGDMK